LCIWQLIHVPTHIYWNGSIRFGSQATVERAIGEIGHKVRSRKAPFANIATLLFERATKRVLNLRCPFLTIPSKETRKRGHLYQSLPIKKEELDGPSEYYNHLAAIWDYLDTPLDMDLSIQRWGKCMIPGDITLRSRVSEEAGQASRSARYFEAQKEKEKEEKTIFGEAIAFYFLPDNGFSLVVYHPLINVFNVLGRKGGTWSTDHMVLKTSSITKLVGIWEYKSEDLTRVHVLRKHGGLDMLNAEEYGVEDNAEENGVED
jgi:hypothetical protein